MVRNWPGEWTWRSDESVSNGEAIYRDGFILIQQKSRFGIVTDNWQKKLLTQGPSWSIQICALRRRWRTAQSFMSACICSWPCHSFYCRCWAEGLSALIPVESERRSILEITPRLTGWNCRQRNCRLIFWWRRPTPEKRLSGCLRSEEETAFRRQWDGSCGSLRTSSGFPDPWRSIEWSSWVIRKRKEYTVTSITGESRIMAVKVHGSRELHIRSHWKRQVPCMECQESSQRRSILEIMLIWKDISVWTWSRMYV